MFLIFAIVIAFSYCSSAIDVQKYLTQFGYRETNTRYVQLDKSLMNFQVAYNLAPTGVLDDDTLKLFQTPRCGNSDKPPDAKKFQPRWSQDNLTFYFDNYTPDLNKDDVRALTRKAFKYWSDVTPLTFDEKTFGDIVLHFGTKKHHDGKQECGYDFDGAGGVLAHAFFPPDGRLHYDDDETYTMKTSSGVNYLWVATHETGHILGLGHDTKNTDSVMYPYYRPYDPSGMNLHTNDIARIQDVYGKRPITTKAPTTTKPPITTKQPITTKVPASTTVPPKRDCVDISLNCHLLKNICNLNQELTEFTKRECRKTCNYCLPPTTKGPCFDRALNCKGVLKFCSRHSVKEHCRKTCKQC